MWKNTLLIYILKSVLEMKIKIELKIMEVCEKSWQRE